MYCNPSWATYLSALLVPMVAICGVVIAYLQWRLSQNKLRLELFDRRFSIYEATKNLLLSIMASGRVKEDDLFKFTVGVGEAKWLLNDVVASYLKDEIYANALQLRVLREELEGVPVGEARTKNLHSQDQLKQWFYAQHSVIDRLFSEFLQLKH